MTLQAELIQGWEKIYKHSEDALNWVDQVKDTSLRLNSEAPDIKLDLYRKKNLANSMRKVAATPMTAGVFGESQMGKSFMISAFAADINGDLTTDFGGQKLDFLKHINPAGGGAEATAVVTRFTRKADKSPDDAYPVHLVLFKEVEIAMILANSWLNDFDQERISYEIDENLINKHLKDFESVNTSGEVVGLRPEDVVALWDYLGDKRSVSKLKGAFWPRAIEIIPYLDLSQRAKLFSILWGQQRKITDIYMRLAKSSEQLGGATHVYAKLDALVQQGENGYTQHNSIMDVGTIKYLYESGDSNTQIRPLINGELQNPVNINNSELAALVCEMIFKLEEPPQSTIVESIDLLDFPGYRSRLKLADVNALDKEEDLITKLFLRGKVAYLFERYSNAQEMNALIVCTGAHKQSEVVEITEVLTNWIYKTQGLNSDERAKRNPGLIWAMTMFDLFIQDSIKKDDDQQDALCDNLMVKTITYRYGNADWMQDWSGNSFNNTYLVRKPGFADFIEVINDKEQSISDSRQAKLQSLRSSFINNKDVKHYVADPADAWDSMMELNDGGITRLSKGLAQVADLDFKLQRISEQLESTQKEIELGLGSWYHKDADDAEGEQLKKAQLIINNLLGSSLLGIGGEIIHNLSLEDEEVHNLYLSGSNEDEEVEENVYASSNLGSLDLGGFDLDLGAGFESSEPQDDTQTTNSTNKQGFAQSLYRAWVSHLRKLSLAGSPLYNLGIQNSEQVIPTLIEEIITASSRMDLAQKIDEKVSKFAQGNSRREQIAQRQVSIAQLVINDFVAYLGYLEMDEDKKPKNKKGKTLFDFYPEINTRFLPELHDKATPPMSEFLPDWVAGLYHLIINNAGHSAGREISIEQNSELGSILRNYGVL